jgi:hypothetical protein
MYAAAPALDKEQHQQRHLTRLKLINALRAASRRAQLPLGCEVRSSPKDSNCTALVRWIEAYIERRLANAAATGSPQCQPS